MRIRGAGPGGFLLLPLLTVFFALAPGSPQSVRAAEENRWTALHASVPRITVRHPLGLASGTGFLYSDDGAIVTAYHVIAGAERAWVHFPAGVVREVDTAALVLPSIDLAVLKLPKDQLPAGVAPLHLATKIPSAGEELTALGYPEGAVRVKEVPARLLRRSQKGDAGGRRDLQLEARLRHGCSGGPVVNDAGEVVGVSLSGHGSLEIGNAAAIETLTRPPMQRLLSEVARSEEDSAEERVARAMLVLDLVKEDKSEAEQARDPLLGFALNGLNAARKKRPDFAEAHFNAAACYLKLKKPNEAIAALRSAVAADPEDIATRLFLAGTLLDKKRWKEAAADAREAVRLAPDFLPSREILAHWCVAARRYPEAEQHLRAGLELKPYDEEARIQLAAVLGMQERPKAALIEYRRVLESAPDNAVAHNGCGTALTELKQHTAAVVSFRTAVRLEPRNAEMRRDLALALCRTGDLKGARREVPVVMELDPKWGRKLKSELGR